MADQNYPRAWELSSPLPVEWVIRAACAGLETDIFFPSDPDLSERGLKICAKCSVRRACREFAESEGLPFGIWGGATARERGWDAAGRRRRAVRRVSRRSPGRRP
ncbi:WhiB family transcriptional regulator [Streptomyces vinaceus]|uniref:WhiB family transcriptional regulator n=1 Tax=Streptomyces vinaceus TaxID=1960 RepID=UPI0037F1B14E